MRFADHTLHELLSELAAPAPSPCGGATAAITAAMACSLIAMVARGAPSWDAGAETESRATELRAHLLELAQQDTEAVAGLLQLADLAPAERSAAIELAIRVPTAIAQAARETAALAELAETHGKRVMRADAAAARLLAEAAARVAEEITAENSG